MVLPSAIFAQSATLSGVVSDPTGTTLPGVTVLIDGTGKERSPILTEPTYWHSKLREPTLFLTLSLVLKGDGNNYTCFRSEYEKGPYHGRRCFIIGIGSCGWSAELLNRRILPDR